LRSNLLSKSETSEILDAISRLWKIEVPRIKNLKMHILDDGARLITGAGIGMIKTNGEYLPLLTETATLEMFPWVVVDMGAVRFMCKGANLMRPGIMALSEFGEGDIVIIKEERYGKYLAVGRAMVSSGEAKSMEKGEVIRNLHYVSDKFWESVKAVRD